jgi:DNA-directed RNA polymerase subunit RPC12/RpoP
LSEVPSVTPQPKTGHWIGIDEEPHEDYECNRCGYVVSTYTANIEPHTEYKYCPNCGAKMVEKQESEE